MAVDVVCVEQQISSGGKFDGTLPPGDFVDTDEIGVRYYPAGATGGLFKFFLDPPARPEKRDRYLDIQRVMLDLNGLDTGDTWSLRIVSDNGDVIWLSDDAGDFVWTPENGGRLIVCPDEQIKLFNGVACTSALFARIWAKPFTID